jgi:hypothetical protein
MLLFAATITDSHWFLVWLSSVRALGSRLLVPPGRFSKHQRGWPASRPPRCPPNSFFFALPSFGLPIGSRRSPHSANGNWRLHALLPIPSNQKATLLALLEAALTVPCCPQKLTAFNRINYDIYQIDVNSDSLMQ